MVQRAAEELLDLALATGTHAEELRLRSSEARAT
jgi:hypothetical protein